MGRFTDKVAIITGSSNGIGRSTAIILAKDGAKVTITGRNAERLEETKQQIISAGVSADNINSVVADITTSAGQDQIINSTIQKFGKIDILVNNAGAAITDPSGSSGLAQNISVYDKTFELNVRSVIELTQKAKPHLIASKGEIVNVSSIAASPQSHPDFNYYSMSKAALDQFTRNIAIELVKSGIRVNCVNPGLVITGFAQAMGAPVEVSSKLYSYMGSHPDCVPIGRVGQPEDIANIIAFLADRSASFYIIGQTITADGGSTLVMAMNTHNLTDLLQNK
ncbi:unnamed protein product [Caenorhabditis angaria]|uniref:Uncharacterized protein n=1 Tax=Caenorhabditis angaria TaxID=860376 RepID=A0A9P1I412_9PELO|nr:unnamed protein product [Caenorhabditis angaria]